MAPKSPNTALRPKMAIVFVAAFVAGGTGAIVVNRSIDVARSRSQTAVECEPIFVALRDLPAGSPVTVWDVKLHDWPKAMVPQAALRADSFDGLAWPENHVARMTVREGQPVLRSHLQAMLARTTQGEGVVAPAESVVADDITIQGREDRSTPATTVASRSSESVITSPAGKEPVSAGAAPVETAVAESTPADPHPADPHPADTIPADPNPSHPHVAHTWPSHEQTSENTTDHTEQPTTQQATPDQTAAHVPEATVASPEKVAGEGWPSIAETVVGGEASMRFLVVPERIAIMADQLTAPPGSTVPKTPAASVAAQPKRATTRAGQPDRGVAREPTTKSRQPQQRAMDSREPPPRRMPESPAVRQRSSQPSSQAASSQTTNVDANAVARSTARTAAVPTPRVRVEPDAESQLAEEAARTPLLKSVFPSMAAGIEKIESEMTRIRRERFGGLFQSATEPDAATDAGSTGRPQTRGR